MDFHPRLRGPSTGAVYVGQPKKTPTPPALKALPQIALCAAHHMLKHKPSEETSFHIYKTPLILLAKPFQIQHQRSPGSPPGRCGRHSGVAGIPSPAGPCPSAGTAALPMAQRCQADSQHQELTSYPSSANLALGDAALASVSPDAIWALLIKTTGHLGTSKRH